MKHWIHLPVAAVVAALVGYGSGLLARPERAARGAAPDVSGLSTALAELRAEQGRLAERLAALPSTPSSAPAASRAPAQDLDQAIAAYMAKRVGAEASDGEVGAPGPADLESAAIADRILTGQVTGDELEALWQTLRQTKRIDAVVAEIERQAELAPHNPDLQNELGKAYIQKLFDVGVGPMASVWGDKADKAFDRALELDETHWEARFQKALALSNWPAFLGKQGESLRHFEILMEQQERGSTEPDQAWTYFFLGNLYDQMGESEKARTTWERGVARFPESPELLQKTAGRAR
jgi:tetratricopeptide (TPR) repeat protein